MLPYWEMPENDIEKTFDIWRREGEWRIELLKNKVFYIQNYNIHSPARYQLHCLCSRAQFEGQHFVYDNHLKFMFNVEYQV